MSADPNAPAVGQVPLWKIGTVLDLPVFTPGGNYVDGKDVELIFWDGSIEHLRYAKAQYNDTTVAQAAQEAAMRHLKIKALQGPMLDPSQLPS